MFTPYNLTPFISVYVHNWPLIHACCTSTVIKTCASSILPDTPLFIHTYYMYKSSFTKNKVLFPRKSNTLSRIQAYSYVRICKHLSVRLLRSNCICHEINLSSNGKRRQFLIYHLVKVVQVHFPSFPVLLPPLNCIRQRNNMVVHEYAIVLDKFRFFSFSTSH